MPELKIRLGSRFSSFEADIYKDMMWLDPANWNEDDPTAEVASLLNLATHFKSRKTDRYTVDESAVKSEWRDLRNTVKLFYPKLKKVTQLWPKIMNYRRDSFPNICKLAEAVLCIGPSNSTVERGFSHLTAMLSDKRLSLSHRPMENLLLLKINHLVFTSIEIEHMLQLAVTCFLTSKKRKLKLDEAEQKVKKRQCTDESDQAEAEGSGNEESTDEIIELDDETVHSDNFSDSDCESENELFEESENTEF